MLGDKVVAVGALSAPADIAVLLCTFGAVAFLVHRLFLLLLLLAQLLQYLVLILLSGIV